MRKQTWNPALVKMVRAVLVVVAVCLLLAKCEGQVTDAPTAAPTTAKPTAAPTTAKPTTAKPTEKPTTAKPTAKPTTAKPTAKPTLSPDEAYELKVETCAAYDSQVECTRDTGNQCRWTAGTSSCATAALKPTTCKYVCSQCKSANDCETSVGAEEGCFWIEDTNTCSTTQKPTAKPTTVKPTAAPTTAKPTTAKPTAKPTTVKPTAAPTTAKPTTAKPTAKPTTVKPTAAPTTAKPTTAKPTAKPTVNPDDVYEEKVATCAAYDSQIECTRDTVNQCRWTAGTSSCATTALKPNTCKYVCSQCKSANDCETSEGAEEGCLWFDDTNTCSTTLKPTAKPTTAKPTAKPTTAKPTTAKPTAKPTTDY
jgi:mucin-2